MSESAEQLVLVLGDLHIPHRKDELPAAFKALLVPGRFHQVLCAGNTTNRHTTDWVRTLAPICHFVRGDLDSGLSQRSHSTAQHSTAHSNSSPTLCRQPSPLTDDGCGLPSCERSDEADFPDQKTVRIGGLTVHLIHGHQVVPWGDPAALLAISRSLDADLLIHGHTHTTQIWLDKTTQRMLINPGSATGAYSPFNTNVVPSFLVLSVRGKSCTVYCYEARGGDVRVTKSDYTSSR